MSVTAGSVMLQAACHLNDSQQLVWTSTVLLPYLNMGIQELQGELDVYDVAPLEETSITIDVNLGATELAQMPVDYFGPIDLFERQRDSQNEWREVREYRSIDPNLLVGSEILQWYPSGQRIFINPPTSDREVFLKYLKTITPALTTATNLDVPNTILYLSLLTAKNAARDAGNSITKANSFSDDIERARDRVIRGLQNRRQGLGVRRKSFRGSH